MNYTTMFGPRRYNKGETYDVDDKTGQTMIGDRSAVAVKEGPAIQAEAETVKVSKPATKRKKSAKK